MSRVKDDWRNLAVPRTLRHLRGKLQPKNEFLLANFEDAESEAVFTCNERVSNFLVDSFPGLKIANGNFSSFLKR